MSPLDHQSPDTYAAGLTDHLRELMDPKDPHCPIKRQFVRSPEEAMRTPADLADPIGDAAHSPIKGIVHRYQDRVLLMPVMACAAYCRFCFRRESVGQPAKGLSAKELEKALAYIAENNTIWEVILSGGDPLLMSANRLRSLLNSISSIPHVQVIRIHTRLPIADPKHVTTEMIDAMSSMDKPVYVVLHCNHTKELSPDTLSVCRAMNQAGIPMLSQTVLLKGVNDNVEVLATLMRSLLAARIKPYYLHHCDPAPGTAHFRTSIEDGKALMSLLWVKVSGLCRPTYVLDRPGGEGKTPINFE